MRRKSNCNGFLTPPKKRLLNKNVPAAFFCLEFARILAYAMLRESIDVSLFLITARLLSSDSGRQLMTKLQCSMFLALALAVFSVECHPSTRRTFFSSGAAGGATQGDDGFVFDHLEELGHNVEYLQASQSSTGDAAGMDLLVLSSTFGSGDARGKFQDVAVPIMQWEEALVRWDHGDPDGNFRMTEFSRNGQDRESSIIMILESAVGHPLAAGLPAGEHEIFEDISRTPQQFGELAPGLIQIAALDEAFADDIASYWTDENGDDQEGPELVLSAIDEGGELGPPGDGFFAPAKRVNFPIEDTGFDLLNETGLLLFNSSIDWLLGDGGGVVLPGDFNMNNQLDIEDIDMLTAASAAGDNDKTFDLNDDDLVDFADVTVWAKDLKNSWIGDSDLDLMFDSGDFVLVFTAGKYETTDAAVWSQGDWNGDGLFNSGDFVAAFSDGGYEMGLRPDAAAAAAIPEPSTAVLLSLAGLGLALFRRR